MNIEVFIRWFTFLTILFYFVFEYFDKKYINDEREEMIRLKTLEFSHKSGVGVLTLLTLIYWYNPYLDGIWFLLPAVLSLLYSEILGKIYFRKTM